MLKHASQLGSAHWYPATQLLDPCSCLCTAPLQPLLLRLLCCCSQQLKPALLQVVELPREDPLKALRCFASVPNLQVKLPLLTVDLCTALQCIVCPLLFCSGLQMLTEPALLEAEHQRMRANQLDPCA